MDLSVVVGGQEIRLGRFTFLYGRDEVLKSRFMHVFSDLADGERRFSDVDVGCVGFEDVPVCFVSSDRDQGIGFDAHEMDNLSWVGRHGEYADSAYLGLSSRDRRRVLGLLSSLGVVSVETYPSDHRVLVVAKHESSHEFVVGVVHPVRNLFVLAIQALIAPRGSVVVFEYPESCLHADVQLVLLDFLVRVSVARDVRFVFSTHSEAFYVRMARWIVREKLVPQDVVYYECYGGQVLSHSVLPHGAVEGFSERIFGDLLSTVIENKRLFLRRRFESSG